jgi:hypothetical protein
MRRYRSLTVVVLLVSLLLFSCAGIQGKWNALSPDEKARVVVSGMQNQLENLFDTGKAYVGANPQYKEVWKTRAVPAFDLANSTLRAVEVTAQVKGTAPAAIYQQMQPLIDKVMSLLIEIGAIKGGV